MCTAAIVLASFGSFASIIPNPVVPHGSDSIRTSDGFHCSQAVAPSAYLDSGVYVDDSGSESNSRDYGIYVRVLIPIGQSQDRIGCKDLYDFEMKYRQQMKALEGIKNEIFN